MSDSVRHKKNAEAVYCRGFVAPRASNVTSITDYNKFYCILLCRVQCSVQCKLMSLSDAAFEFLCHFILNKRGPNIFLSARGLPVEEPWCRISHINTVGYGLSERKQVGEN